jgi:hypothetical protein
MVDYKGKDGGGVAISSIPHGSSVAAEPSSGADAEDGAIRAAIEEAVRDGVIQAHDVVMDRLTEQVMGTARSMLTFRDVERGLVDVMELWRRTPGDGRGSPFASDGPWELADRDLYGPDVDKDAPLRPAPLTRAEVAERDRVSAWIELAPARDRRLVSLAVVQMSAKGYKSPGFRELLPKMGLTLGADGLRKRYNRAIYKIASELNLQAEARRAAEERR